MNFQVRRRRPQPRIPLEAQIQKILERPGNFFPARVYPRQRRAAAALGNVQHRGKRVIEISPRRFPRDHLDGYASQRPNIGLGRVPGLSKHLRGHPGNAANYCPSENGLLA